MTTTRRPRQGLRPWFALPALLVFSVVMILPILVNSLYSFTDWNGFMPTWNFIGGANFLKLIGDQSLIAAAGHTIEFTLINAPLQIVLAMVLALCLVGPGIYRAFLRTVLVLPIAISGVVLGFLGTLIFDPRTGLLHTASAFPGFNWLDQNWLSDPTLAMFAVVGMNVWQWTGFTMLIFLASLSTQPTEPLEASVLDGANAWQRFWHVTWPHLAPAVTINVLLTVIGGLKIFDIVYVLTKGGPAGATETVVARVALQSGIGQYSYSAASNVVLTLVIIGISFLLLTFLRRREVAA